MNSLLLVGNPRRRKGSKRRSSRRSRLLSGFRASGIMSQLSQASIGAAGALAVNALVNHSPLPPQLRVGYGGFAVRGLAAILLGSFGRRFIGPSAVTMANGALVVTIADAIRATVSPMIPGVNLSGMGFYSPGMVSAQPRLPSGINRASLPGGVNRPTLSLAGGSGGKIGAGKLSMYPQR